MQAIIIQYEDFQKLMSKLNSLDNLIRQVQERDIDSLYFNNTQLARYLGTSKRSLQRYRDEGLITYSKVGSKIFYKFSDVVIFLESHRVGAFETKSIGPKK